jgi:hypothetical protein
MEAAAITTIAHAVQTAGSLREIIGLSRQMTSQTRQNNAHEMIAASLLDMWLRCHLALQTQPPDVRDNRVQNQPAFRDSIYLIRSI